jgi:hypothetical protein
MNPGSMKPDNESEIDKCRLTEISPNIISKKLKLTHPDPVILKIISILDEKNIDINVVLTNISDFQANTEDDLVKMLRNDQSFNSSLFFDNEKTLLESINSNLINNVMMLQTGVNSYFDKFNKKVITFCNKKNINIDSILNDKGRPYHLNPRLHRFKNIWRDHALANIEKLLNPINKGET